MCLTDIDEEGIRRAEESLRDEGLEVFGLRVDVTDRAQVESAVEEIVQRYGRLDILVNNAGVIRDNLLFKMTDEDWQTVMDVHLKGAFYCSRAAQKVMVEQKYGRIINISSTSALGNRGTGQLFGGQGGTAGLHQDPGDRAGQIRDHGERRRPGVYRDGDDSGHGGADRRSDFEQFVEEVEKQIPVGRIGQPEDIAAALLFFASEEASFVNGQVLYVAGGPKD